MLVSCLETVGFCRTTRQSHGTHESFLPMERFWQRDASHSFDLALLCCFLPLHTIEWSCQCMHVHKLFFFFASQPLICAHFALPHARRRPPSRFSGYRRQSGLSCPAFVVPLSSLPPLGPQDLRVMEAEEESPHYVAALSTNDSNGGATGEPKRTSSRNWGQHWQDLDRNYFRPVSAADMENLRTEVRWVDGGCWICVRKCAFVACGMGPDRLPLPPLPHSSRAWNK